jgi:imidazolonepropionase-like amidohydrolase
VNRRPLGSYICLLLLSAAMAPGAQAPSGQRADRGPLALVGGTLIDGTGGALVRNSVVLIRGDRIEKIGSAQTVPVPTGYERISTDGMTVLPGLWDPHVHLIYAGHPNLGTWLKAYGSRLEREVIPATAEQFLLAGVTSVRDLGAPLEILNVRKRIEGGEIPGPTVYAAGPFLTSGNAFGPHSVPVADEADARRRTRRLAAAGVSVIKFVNAAQMGATVARAIVDEAHSAGLKATAHARSDAEIRVGLEAGVDEFQHIGAASPQYPDDIVAAIRGRIGSGRPLYWSVTLGPELNAGDLASNPEFLDDPSNYRGLPAVIADDVRSAVAAASPKPPAPEIEQSVKRKVGQLRELGVEFVFGSDEGTFGQTATQATWRELDVWVRHLGLQPMDAIRKATLDAAKYLGADRQSGSVTEGKFADVIAVRGDPLRHVGVLGDPVIVVKHGRRYK